MRARTGEAGTVGCAYGDGGGEMQVLLFGADGGDGILRAAAMILAFLLGADLSHVCTTRLSIRLLEAMAAAPAKVPAVVLTRRSPVARESSAAAALVMI